MTKLLDWLIREPEKATSNDLALQLRHAEEALAVARNAAATAQAIFDADPSKEAQALKAAEVVARAELHVGRAERLLAAKREEEAEQARQARRDASDAKNVEYGRLHADLRDDDAVDVVAALVAAAKAQAGRNAKLAKLRECGDQLARMQAEVDGLPYNDIRDALRRNEPVGTLDTAISLFRNEVDKARGTDMELYRAGHEIITRLTKGIPQ